MDRRTSENGVVYYSSPLLEQAGIPHAFSTRLGGVSAAPFDSLNLGNPSGCDLKDDGEQIERNYARLFEAIGRAGRERCRMHQVHGAIVHDVQRGEPFESGRKGDAIVSDDPSRVIAIRVADCVPILLATENGRLVAAIHAGWRGVIAGVVTESVVQMLRRSGATAEHLLAAIGPCISEPAFEVGSEVVAAFAERFGSDSPTRMLPDKKGRVDLRAAVRLQLLRRGVLESRIDQTDRCTVRDAAEFFSHRREHGITGRMAAVISASE
jgi:hypothetical protein